MHVPQQNLTTIMVIKLPDGKLIQVAGDQESITFLIRLLSHVPEADRGHGWWYEPEQDAHFVKDDGEVFSTIPGGNIVRIMDLRPLHAEDSVNTPEPDVQGVCGDAP